MDWFLYDNGLRHERVNVFDNNIPKYDHCISCIIDVITWFLFSSGLSLLPPLLKSLLSPSIFQSKWSLGLILCLTLLLVLSLLYWRNTVVFLIIVFIFVIIIVTIIVTVDIIRIIIRNIWVYGNFNCYQIYYHS